MTESKTQFGLIFHWGLYSVPAFDIVNTRRRILNGSEWYYKRLTETGKFHPVSNYKETQEYHNKNYSNKNYYDLVQYFAEGKIEQQIEEWMKLAISVNATYVILTAKHHDGFCLWPSKAVKYHSKTDLVALFCTLARKYKLKVGLYYSWSEFDHSATKEYFHHTVKPQMMELQAYNPDIWWFDGQWVCKSKYSQQCIDEICTILKKNNPHIDINDRINEQNKMKADMEYLGAATYRVYADRYLPEKAPQIRWEHINTIGFSWGRNKQQKTEHYKSGKELQILYEKVKSLGGNFLLNLGPNADGTLDPYEVAALQDFALQKKEAKRL